MTADDHHPEPARARGADRPTPLADLLTTTEPDRPRPRRGRLLLRAAALGALGLALLAAGTGYLAYRSLDAGITRDDGTARELEMRGGDRPPEPPGDARTVLVIGSDDPSSLPGAVGGIGARSDTVFLLHLSGDRQRATAVSFPRDLLVDVPDCTGPDGGTVPAARAQFNWAYSHGGPACTIRTVEALTGVRVDHHVDIDFAGFRDLVDAVGGVEVHLTEDVRDEHTELDLTAGRQVLDGDAALAYVRGRQGIGDGSDTARIERQHQFLGLLLDELRSSGVLLNPARLYPVLRTATASLTVDPALASLSRLHGLVGDLRDLPEGGLGFVTVPRTADPVDPDRDVLVQPDADTLFAQLRDDLPVTSRPRDGAPAGGLLPAAGAAEDAEAGSGPAAG
ncbi:LCP family protein [Streptomyces lonarensis]|uniref:LCP family protein n=1 Tax=Streptomyces lonarensis TaxID=700599 RepID=A0A7X6CYF3_9ACTN|nr:LCP family protein [Streptomyces lonarensis]NJQ04867.1 LCP family protein [Streptomyces lonarensis]